ncbi:molecular chaperone TorD family protein [bacterium]|nr:molecular chaperone TorD family protein [bacterium]
MEGLRDLSKAEESKRISAIYKLLSRVFMREVDAGFLRQLRTECFYETLKGVGINLGPEFLNQEEDALLENLAVEYAYLFIVPGKVYLYESVYSDSGLLYGEPAKQVEDFYQKCGLKVTDDTLMPDHIGLELELMSYLKQRQFEAGEEGNEAGVLKWTELAQEFMGAHPGKWAEEFFSSVQQESLDPFYKQMAELGKRLMEIEMNEVRQK